MTLDFHKRFTVPTSSINDTDRIRQDYGDIEELAESIRTLGLLQPIVINLNNVLIAGGRRLRAMRHLGWTDVPVTYFEVADETTLRILEVEENVRRKPMTWQERVLAITQVHDKQFLSKTLAGEQWTMQATGELLGMSKASVSYAKTLSVYILRGDKEIAKCDKMSDAIALLVKRQAEESNKILAKLTLPPVDLTAANKLLQSPLDGTSSPSIFSAPPPSSGQVVALVDDGEELPGVASTTVVSSTPIDIPLSRMCLFQQGDGDSMSIVESMPDSSIDHIITDWPYGIDMSNIDQANANASVADTTNQHDVDRNKTLQSTFIKTAYRLLKDGGFFITFTDISVWQSNYDAARSAGFKVQPWPLIWHKTHRCSNQAANYNFTKDYEIAIVCRKGNGTLLTPQASSIYVGATDEATRALSHPFAKPPKLWQWIFAAVAYKGQTVLDPFAGVGSSTLAAVEYGLSPIAVECNEKYHAAQVVNLAAWYRKSLKNVNFT